jgi:imidazole glycerol-phosphate synthase subunit HisH
VVPGVGAFAACMAGLTAVGGPAVIARRRAAGRPILAICVGHQVLFAAGIEHGVRAEGCGVWPGTVAELQAERLPHMGWNTVAAPADSVLFAGLDPATRFYFVHSYAVRQWELEPGPPFTPPLVTWAEHGDRFVAAVENGPLCATQFHPEKSADAGAHLLRNWLATL